MLDGKCKPKISFLFITDLLGLTVCSSERLVHTCEDHPKSTTNSNFSEILFFFFYPPTGSKNRGKFLENMIHFKTVQFALHLQSYRLF